MNDPDGTRFVGATLSRLVGSLGRLVNHRVSRRAGHGFARAAHLSTMKSGSTTAVQCLVGLMRQFGVPGLFASPELRLGQVQRCELVSEPVL